MTEATVATEVHESLNGKANFSAKIALHFLAILNERTNTGNLILGKIICSSASVDLCLLEDLLRLLHPDTEDIGESADDPLVSWKVNSCDTWHFLPLTSENIFYGKLSLSLFMLGSTGTDHVDLSLSLDNLAVSTDWLY